MEIIILTCLASTALCFFLLSAAYLFMSFLEQFIFMLKKQRLLNRRCLRELSEDGDML